MKTVTLLYDFFSEPGGLERVMFFQAKVLRKAGYKVKFAFAYVDEKLKNELLKDYEVIEYSKLPLNYKSETLQICSSFLMSNFLEKLKDTDLIICHSFPSSYVAYRMYNKYNIPYIQFLHHHPQFLYHQKASWANNTLKRKVAYLIGKCFGQYPKYIDKKCVKNARQIMVNSGMVQKIILNIYKRKGKLIYPTVDPVFFGKPSNKREILKKHKIPDNFILASGRIVRLKRFDYLLEAYSRLPEEIKKELFIVFAGKENEKEKANLISLADKLSIKNILFLSYLNKEELRVLYSAAKMTVLTCPGEYFGLVPVEAMASGCPVVAWKDNSGPQETVTEGISGYLAKPYDSRDMSEKISKTLSKRWDKDKITKSAERFSEKAIEKEFLSEVKKIIN